MAEGILDRIVRTKREEVERLLPLRKKLEASVLEAPPPFDLRGALAGDVEVAVMAEVKRRSPGAGHIRPGLDPTELARAYESAGASAISVLTDREYFGGGLGDLRRVKGAVSVPVFRKDFIIDETQLLEARAAGADGTLLIARILDPKDLRSLLAHGEGLGLSILVEVHDRVELERALAVGSRLIGINNRNLEDFSTSLDVTLRLLDAIPPEVTLVSESGIRTPAEVDRLGAAGVNAILVGESLLRAPDPGAATGELVGRPRVSRHDA